MKTLARILFLLFTILMFSCDKPDALKEKAFLEIENLSSSYDVTGVYYSNSGYGSNRLSGTIRPGETKTFKLSAEGDYIYNIKVTSTNVGIGDYTFDDVHFYDDRRVTVTLYENEWDNYFTY